ncbi:MAG: hypothetical protein WC460_05995 [Patescibacteria group bacterium]
MEFVFLFTVIFAVLVAGLVIASSINSSRNNGQAIAEDSFGSKETAREKLRALSIERKRLKKLARRVNWAENRLIKYPYCCKYGTKQRALRIVWGAGKLDGKFGLKLKKDIREKAVMILKAYTEENPRATGITA